MTETIPDLDIWRSANLLVKQHGDDAPIEAAMRADAMLDKGDLDGCATWKRRSCGRGGDCVSECKA